MWFSRKRKQAQKNFLKKEDLYEITCELFGAASPEAQGTQLDLFGIQSGVCPLRGDYFRTEEKR